MNGFQPIAAHESNQRVRQAIQRQYFLRLSRAFQKRQMLVLLHVIALAGKEPHQFPFRPRRNRLRRVVTHDSQVSRHQIGIPHQPAHGQKRKNNPDKYRAAPAHQPRRRLTQHLIDFATPQMIHPPQSRGSQIIVSQVITTINFRHKYRNNSSLIINPLTPIGYSPTRSTARAAAPTRRECRSPRSCPFPAPRFGRRF